MSRCDAVEAMYQDMAARHRSRFRSIHVCSDTRTTFASGATCTNTCTADPQSRRAREDRRRQATIHQAVAHEGSEVPATAPHCQEGEQEDLHPNQAVDFLLSVERIVNAGLSRKWRSDCTLLGSRS